MLNAAMQFPARRTQFFFSIFVKTKKKFVAYRYSPVAFAIIDNNNATLPFLASKGMEKGMYAKVIRVPARVD